MKNNLLMNLGQNQSILIINKLIRFLKIDEKTSFNHLPGVSERDTMGFKIEALRFYLEKELGSDSFF